MITYTYPWPELPSVKVPKLHRVNHNSKYNWGEMHYWCKENCRAPFYISMAWMHGKFVDFEDDVDATAFAMRFA